MASALPDFGGFRRIVQAKGQLSIQYDTGQGQGWHRTVPITDAPHAPANVRQWWGDSRAKWEGKTLVVDVTNFSPKSNFNGAHENLHLTERWTRLDADTIEYTVRVEDDDHVGGALDGHAHDEAAGRSDEPHLSRAAVPRRQLRHGRPPHRRPVR